MAPNPNDQIIMIPMPEQQGSALPIPQRSDRPDLMDKIKPDLIVEVIRHRLLGETFIDGQWKAVTALKNRKLSEVGAWELANLMLSVSTVNISISKFKDYEIKSRALSIAKTAQYLMLAHWREYGIRNTAQQHFVHELIFSNTLAVLKQADDASIQELLKGTVYENRNVNQQPKESGGNRIKRALGLG